MLWTLTFLLGLTTVGAASHIRGGATAVEEGQSSFLTLAGDSKRPARVVLPDNYDKSRPWPVVMVLHGYGSSGNGHDFYMGVSARTTSLGFIAILANGTFDPTPQARFWNGKACCDHNELNPDDKSFLVGLVDEAKAKFNVDSSKVYAFGHSNGGLMSQILACQESEVFSGIVGLSPNWIPAKCWTTTAKKVLLVSGTRDQFLPTCVAEDNMQRWAGYLGCSAEPTATYRKDYDCEEDAPDDFDSHYDKYKDKNCGLPGEETVVKEWRSCTSGAKMQLWLMEGATHSPALSSKFSDDALNFLLH